MRAFDSYLDPFDDHPFDPAEWAAAGEREDERARGPMARAAAMQPRSCQRGPITCIPQGRPWLSPTGSTVEGRLGNV
ncbi:MAG: hypothetical protein ABGY75_16690, partial [Gemmataceae bacterium]